MASLLIRGLDESIKQKLRTRAASNSRSMAAEAREILREGLSGAKPKREPSLVESMRRRVAPFGGFDLKLPKREMGREPPDFTK